MTDAKPLGKCSHRIYSGTIRLGELGSTLYCTDCGSPMPLMNTTTTLQAIEATEALLAEAAGSLLMLVAAASDTDRNMRDADGHCDDCGRTPGRGHDDPDCGMAGLAVGAREARALLDRIGREAK